MSEGYVPDPALEPEPSPAVVAKRNEVALCQEIVFILGNASIKAKEAAHAHEIMTYLDNMAQAKIRELDSLIASEILGAPVKVEGTKISMADSH